MKVGDVVHIPEEIKEAEQDYWLINSGSKNNLNKAPPWRITLSRQQGMKLQSIFKTL